MVADLVIRKLDEDETETALSLVWKVFLEYEAPDYSEEGVDEFHKSIHNEGFIGRLSFYGAFISDKLVGVIATRNEGSHIALFFVEGEHQGKGIGRKLFETVQSLCQSERMTVNSSPYASAIYHKLGFKDTDTEQTVNGLRFIPMELITEK
ncbi:MAG: GNAT family N-acetyltransferase [Erysipelotrichaceae bacterium]|nr:GNAT family N-acetyltransferase [Erysipelotrichaceae bacterium]